MIATLTVITSPILVFLKVNYDTDWSQLPELRASSNLFYNCTNLPNWDGQTEIDRTNTDWYFTAKPEPPDGVYYFYDSEGNAYLTNEHKEGYSNFEDGQWDPQGKNVIIEFLYSLLSSLVCNLNINWNLLSSPINSFNKNPVLGFESLII